jgi:LysM repeat protein
VAVVLLGLYRFLATAGPAPLVCPEGAVNYQVKSGESCWEIAKQRGVTVDNLVGLNIGLDCTLLEAGKEICVPAGK